PLEILPTPQLFWRMLRLVERLPSSTTVWGMVDVAIPSTHDLLPSSLQRYPAYGIRYNAA
ncbi:MAG: hypothetical protein MK003_13395, partial [Pseudomonadales bacterium]|nr:hypothetical protein [Pseudomonadales bacterium]